VILDVEGALESLGLTFDVRGHEANSLCPMHFRRTGKEDHSPSWWINLDNGQHICFSCGYRGNLVQLVCDVKEFYLPAIWGTEDSSYDLDAGKAWLSSAMDVSPTAMLEALRSLPNYIREAPKPIEMTDARLALFVEPPLDALSDRRLSLEAARKYKVLWDEPTSRWILPLRDPYFNRLYGWQEKGHRDRYFRNRPAGIQKSKTLFGVENQKDDVVIVVESPLDCLRLETAGIEGAVATCGAGASEAQVKLLRASDKVIVAFDNPKLDQAGKKASDEFRAFARRYGMDVFYFNYGDSGKKDPGDMTDEELRFGVDSAVSSIFGESAYV
jgi:hypothetical protein